MADRLQTDPTAWRWPSWAQVQHPRGNGSVWKVPIKGLKAADVTGYISSSSLAVLNDIAWQVELFDVECARAAPPPDEA